MKINVTVDLEDFYYEDETGNSFAEEIKADISHRVKTQLWTDFKAQGLNAFSETLTREINRTTHGRIEQMVNELLNGEKVRRSSYDKELNITFKDAALEYIKQASVDNSPFMNQIRGIVKEAADNLGNELKNRYDILFASQLVAKMNESGLLKDDVARLLLDNGNNG